jgi:hypothetical protein
MQLDPLKQVTPDWRDLAGHFKVPSVDINYWKGMMAGNSMFSPTETLIDWLKSKQQPATVSDLKEALEKIGRYDVLRALTEEVDKMAQ